MSKETKFKPRISHLLAGDPRISDVSPSEEIRGDAPEGSSGRKETYDEQMVRKAHARQLWLLTR